MNLNKAAIAPVSAPLGEWNTKLFFQKRIRPNLILYIFLIPAVVYALIFLYFPLYGLVIAFKRYNPGLGILNSKWVGLLHFKRFFSAYNFWPLIRNTLLLSLFGYLAGIPVAPAFALTLNYMKQPRLKKFVQTVTYAPHFISTVVLVGMLFIFLSPRNGLINIIFMKLGFNPISFMIEENWFRPVFILSGIWQNFGWAAIIYMAVLAGVSPEHHEAAIVDGANKLQRIWHIDIPHMLPTFIILQILALGRIMTVGFEKVLLMQTSPNLNVSEIIATYTYRLGIQMGEFSYTTAIGFFNNIINLILLLLANSLANRLTKISVI